MMMNYVVEDEYTDSFLFTPFPGLLCNATEQLVTVCKFAHNTVPVSNNMYIILCEYNIMTGEYTKRFLFNPNPGWKHPTVKHQEFVRYFKIGVDIANVTAEVYFQQMLHITPGQSLFKLTTFYMYM